MIDNGSRRLEKSHRRAWFDKKKTAYGDLIKSDEGVRTGRDAINDKVGFLLTKGEQNRAYCDPKSDPTPLKAIS